MVHMTKKTAGLSASGFATAIADSPHRTYGNCHKRLKYRVSLFYIPPTLNCENMELWSSQPFNRYLLLAPKFGITFLRMQLSFFCWDSPLIISLPLCAPQWLLKCYISTFLWTLQNCQWSVVCCCGPLITYIAIQHGLLHLFWLCLAIVCLHNSYDFRNMIPCHWNQNSTAVSDT